MSSLIERKSKLPANQTKAAIAVRRTTSWWPDADSWRAAGAYGSGIVLLWLLIYVGANWITSLHDYRVSLRTELDFTLPFMPGTAIVYLSLFPMLWLSPFVLRSPGGLRSFAYALAIVIVVSGIGFLILPVEPIDAISIGKHDLGEIFQFADWINLTHNYFPSLHVGMAVVCAISYGRAVPRKAAIFFSLWALAIALATLLTRQHYIVDVLAGGILGLCVASYFAPNPHRVRNTLSTDRF